MISDVYTRFYSCRLCWASKRRGLYDSSNFPQVDDLRFIELREVEVEDGLSQATLQLRNKKSLVSPTHLIQLGVV